MFRYSCKALTTHSPSIGEVSLQYVHRGLLSSSATVQSDNAVKEIVVIGGGLMGAGIAQVAAQTNHKVTLVDISNDVLVKSKSRIETSLQRVAKKTHRDDTQKAANLVKEMMSRIDTDTTPDAALATAHLVIEAVVENMDLKHKIFKDLDQKAPKSVMFASNTSSLPITDIGKVLSAERKPLFGGLHFFNPVPMMKLLEIVRVDSTSDQTFEAFTAFGAAMGKKTVACKDTPGFIVNRLLVPAMLEAVRLAERGDASVVDIDTAMELGAGHPMGPFRLADYVGLDTVKFIIDGWHKAHPEVELFKPSPMVDKLVSEGKLGVKSGSGFYDYAKK